MTRSSLVMLFGLGLACGSKTPPPAADPEPVAPPPVAEEAPPPPPVPTPPAPEPQDVYTAHEWGTFTTVADGSGTVLAWAPLEGSVDLPDFVHATPGESLSRIVGKDTVRTYQGTGTTVRMETPVIYFHSSRPRSVSVTVDFPKGAITEWYPPAERTPNRLVWERVDLAPDADLAALEVEPADAGNHYYAARDTEAVPLRAGERTEKFLFYRGCGVFGVPLSIRLQGTKQITLTGNQLAGVVVFEKRDGAVGYRLVDPFEAETSVARPTLDGNVADLERELQRLLAGTGLTEREAAAMVATWRGVWFEEGLRVFYLVPRPFTDAVLPLRIEPAPQQLVRTLVGRMEILTPEMEKDIAAQAKLLGTVRRVQALQRLARYGRFARPILERLRKTIRDPRQRAAIDKLLIDGLG